MVILYFSILVQIGTINKERKIIYQHSLYFTYRGDLSLLDSHVTVNSISQNHKCNMTYKMIGI